MSNQPMDWKEKLRVGFAQFTTNAAAAFTDFGQNTAASVNRTLDGLQKDADEFFEDPNGFTSGVITKIGDGAAGIASEFVTYVGAGNVSPDFYDWIMVLSTVTTKQVLPQSIDRKGPRNAVLLSTHLINFYLEF